MSKSNPLFQAVQAAAQVSGLEYADKHDPFGLPSSRRTIRRLKRILNSKRSKRVLRQKISVFHQGVWTKEWDWSRPYHLRQLQTHASNAVDSDEIDTFSYIYADEATLFQTNTWLSGPLDLAIANRQINCRRPYCLKGWVESDRVCFQGTKAKRILYVNQFTAFRNFAKAGNAKQLNCLLVCGLGIPHVQTRRVLHRLSSELQLPVYVLTDNDTWGYFAYSVIKNGMVAPGSQTLQLAVPKARYVGLRAGDFALLDKERPRRLLYSMKRIHRHRLDALRQYSCFKSKAWKDELLRFEQQQGNLELGAIWSIGVKRFVREILAPRIESHDYLD